MMNTVFYRQLTMNMMKITSLLPCAIIFINALTLAVDTKTPIYILGLYPMSGAWPGGEALLPASTIAFQHINNNSEVLNDYELVLIERDTKCDGGIGTDAMYQELYNKTTTKIVILGCGCSVSTQPTAQTSYLWNLVQLSYGAASPKLSDRSIFKRFFRTYPPESVFNIVKFAMLEEFGWRKVATLNEALELFSLPTADFLDDASDNGIEIITAESFGDSPINQVTNLKKHGVRIIVGNFYENRARQIFCQAYKEGLYGPKYVWIITGWYSYHWWRVNDTTHPHDCTTEQMDTVVDGYFGIDVLHLSRSTSPGVSGRTSAQFLDEYHAFVGGEPENLRGYDEASYGYDGAWTIALWLHKADRILKTWDPPRTIADFSYDDDEMGDLLFSLMNQTNFEGVSGPVQFTETGDRKALMQLEQNQNGNEVVVGYYNPGRIGNELQWNDDVPVYWPGGSPPVDAFIEQEVNYTINIAWYYTVVILAVIGLLFASSFLVFNIRFRNKRIVKMSSPNMNNLILVGGILSYLTMIFSGLDHGQVVKSTHRAMCKLSAWTMSLGFSFLFGAMFSKTYRVHKIFTNKSLKRTKIKDYQLLIVVAIIAGFDVIILTLWEIIDPMNLVMSRGTEVPNKQNDDIINIPILVVCESNWQTYWLGCILVKDALMLIFGAFLAWETRKVTVPALNDSKYIGICIYNVLVLSIIGVPISFILNDTSQQYAIKALFLFFATTVTLGFVFIPKIMARNEVQPQGQMLTATYMEDENPKVPSVSSNVVTKQGQKKQVAELKQKIQELESLIETKNCRIRELEND